MANYYGFTRTNYFKVTDEDQLQDIVKRIVWNDAFHTFFSHDADGFGFGSEGTICGLRAPDQNDEEEDADDDPEDVYKALQRIVAPDDAIIITEIGFENLRYLVGFSVVITRDQIECVDLRDESLRKAQELLQNPDFHTRME